MCEAARTVGDGWLMTAQIRVHDVDFSNLGVDCETMNKPEACQLLAGG